MAKDAFAKMDVQLNLFMKTTQPQKKWGKEELLKDYAAIMKQLQPGQVKLIAGEQWAMTKDALYKEDQVCVPEVPSRGNTLMEPHGQRSSCSAEVLVVLRPPLSLQQE